MSAAGSWTFWKKRFGRLLVGLGLALLATQWLPSLPRDQRVLYRAPPGYLIKQLELQYSSGADSETLVSANLHPAVPSSAAAHALRLPDGVYTVFASARLVPPRLVADERNVSAQWQGSLHLAGETETVSLPDPISK